MSKIIGKVVSGRGEGQFFLSLEKYAQEFEKLLGHAPFAGTLNVRVLPEYEKLALELRMGDGLVVDGFDVGNKKYFQIKCHKAKILGEQGVIIFPFLNHHPPEVLEFVCAENMRKKFGLKDGAQIEVEILPLL
ncbi:MAG: DUF120 domain-containing protein [Candidatus Micrarchaeia archaeon]